MRGHGSPDAGFSTLSNGAIYLTNILSRRPFTSSTARFWLEDPCQLSNSANDVLASGSLRQGIARTGLSAYQLERFDWVGLKLQRLLLRRA